MLERVELHDVAIGAAYLAETPVSFVEILPRRVTLELGGQVAEVSDCGPRRGDKLGGSMNELLDFVPLVNGNVLQEFLDHRIILLRHGDVGNSKGR